MDAELTDDDWHEAAAHLFAALRDYRNAITEEHVLISPDAYPVLHSLALRYEDGEREPDLYHDIMAIPPMTPGGQHDEQ